MTILTLSLLLQDVVCVWSIPPMLMPTSPTEPGFYVLPREPRKRNDGDVELGFQLSLLFSAVLLQTGFSLRRYKLQSCVASGVRACTIKKVRSNFRNLLQLQVTEIYSVLHGHVHCFGKYLLWTYFSGKYIIHLTANCSRFFFSLLLLTHCSKASDNLSGSCTMRF